MSRSPSPLRSHRVALLAALALPYVASAQAPSSGEIAYDEIGVLKLFDEFVSSGAAASRCAAPDDTSAARFLSNFQWVSIHATREIGRQLPASSSEDVSAELAKRSKAIKERTHELVKAEGCESSSVQELVHRFAIQAAWHREG